MEGGGEGWGESETRVRKLFPIIQATGEEGEVATVVMEGFKRQRDRTWCLDILGAR